MRHLSERAVRLTWSAVVVFYGGVFLAFSVWLTLMLPEMLPVVAAAGFDGYLMAMTGAFYFLAVFLLFAGLKSFRRTFVRPQGTT